MNKRVKVINLLTIIFLVIQLFIGYGLYKSGQINYLYEIIAISVLFLAYTFWEIKSNLYMSNYIRFLIMATLLAHVFIGDYLDFYSKSFIFDKALHGFGTYSFTLFSYAIINQMVTSNGSKKAYNFIFIIALGMALGQLFEFLEFAIDLTIKPSPPAQGDVFDTNLDMILNTLGSIVAALHLNLSKYKFIK
ncbi:hypothetical protein [Clostridium sp.]|uniref:hypothetical protein n=1 Tax=Clostridium sp. TaxID=1506 RepID=UPI002FC5B8DE